MATKLYKRKDVNADRIVIWQALWSKDWFSLTPWSDKGEIQPFFGTRAKVVNQGDYDVSFRYWYIGPIAIMRAET